MIEHIVKLKMRRYSWFYDAICSECGEIGTAMYLESARRTKQYHEERMQSE